MSPEDYKLTINALKDRYSLFEISFEQAEKIYAFEQVQYIPSTEQYFSDWEEFDFRFDNFKKILNEEQFGKFCVWHKENIKRREQQLIESDERQTKYIEYHEAILDFYEQRIFPDYFKEEFSGEMVTIHSQPEKSKVEFLKNEYKAFLEGLKKETIIAHYRNCRLFQPLTLKLSLVRLRLLYILPRYRYFRNHMDEPTKATAAYLLKKFQFIPENHKEFFKQTEEEISRFAKEAQDRYIGPLTGGVMMLTETEEEKKENQIMMVLLIDKDKYNYEL